MSDNWYLSKMEARISSDLRSKNCIVQLPGQALKMSQDAVSTAKSKKGKGKLSQPQVTKFLGSSRSINGVISTKQRSVSFTELREVGITSTLDVEPINGVESDVDLEYPVMHKGMSWAEIASGDGTVVNVDKAGSTWADKVSNVVLPPLPPHDSSKGMMILQCRLQSLGIGLRSQPMYLFLHHLHLHLVSLLPALLIMLLPHL